MGKSLTHRVCGEASQTSGIATANLKFAARPYANASECEENMKKSKVYWCLIILSVIGVLGLSFIPKLVNSGSGSGKKQFIVGFDAEFPPYGYLDENGEYVGFDLDLAEEVCRRNNWELVKRPISWEAKDSELSSGTISCIWNGFTMNGREDQYTWSTPYVDNSQVVVVKKSSGIKSLSDLEGKILVVQKESSALAALTGEDVSRENEDLLKSLKSLEQVDDYNFAFMNLETGAIDAIAMDIGVAHYQLENKRDDYIILDEHISSEKYGIGFKLGNTKLRDEVQSTILEMLYDGTFEHISEKWGLTDSVCLTFDDTKYIDGMEVPAIDTSSIEKIDFGNEDVKEASKSTDRSISNTIKQLLKGMVTTLEIFALTLIFSMPLGLLLTFVRMSKVKVLQWIAKIYISIMRGTPLMLQLLVVFFAPYYVFGINTSYNYRFYAVIIGFSLNYAAYFAEIYRSGIQGIPNGQREAAMIMGYGKIKTFTKIIFPQMIKRVMPPVTNEIITLVKDTSLAFALAYTEMFTMAKQISSAQASLTPLFVAGLFYYIFNFIVAFVMEKLEKSMEYYR